MCRNFSFYFVLVFWITSSSSLKTTTDNSSSRFNFRNENYTALDLLWGTSVQSPPRLSSSPGSSGLELHWWLSIIVS